MLTLSPPSHVRFHRARPNPERNAAGHTAHSWSYRRRPATRDELLEFLGLAFDRVDRAADYLRSVREGTTCDMSSGTYDAVEVVRSCMKQEKVRALGRGVLLEGDVRAEEVWLEGDSLALYHILTNLISNAVSVSKPAHSVRVHVSRSSERLLIGVSDSGPGIPPEHLEHVFDFGFTTDCANGGTGIGLAVVRELAQNVLGGTVTLSSAAGSGSEFTVTIPIPSST